MSSPLQPMDPADVLWEGKPVVGVTGHDVKVGLAVFGCCALVLCGGLWLGFGLEPRAALQVGGLFATVVAAVIVLARAVGGTGRNFGAFAAFLGAVSLAKSLQNDPGASSQGPFLVGATVLVCVVLVWRLRQRLRTRYRVSADRVVMGEDGRYVITFTFQGSPRVAADMFGDDLADLVFPPPESAQLITQEGKVFRMPGKSFRFHRVRDPKRVLEALGKSASGSEPVGAG